MNNLVLLVLISALSFISSKSFAVGYPLPVGHQESFMANTGAALEDSPGNVIYNPAGLGFRTSKDLNLTVSGNALGQQRFQLNGLEDETSDLKMRPLLAAGVYSMGDGFASVYIANPVSIKIIQGQNVTVGAVNSRVALDIQFDVITGGVAYGALINKDFSWGIGAGLYYTTQEIHNYYSIVQSGVSAQTSYSESRAKSTKLILTPGIMLRAADFWTLGFSGQILPWNINSTASQLQSQTNSANPTQVTQSSLTYDPSPSFSYGLTLGQQLTLGNNHLYLDVNYSGKSTQKGSDGEEQKSPESWSYNFGWKNSTSEKWQPLAGFSYSDLNTSESYLATAGLSMMQRRNELVLGAYFQKNNPKVSSSSPSDSIGVMFSSNVAY